MFRRSQTHPERSRITNGTEVSDAGDYIAFDDLETPLILYVYTLGERSFLEANVPKLTGIPIKNFFCKYQDAITAAQKAYPQHALSIIKISISASLFYEQKDVANFDIWKYEVDMNQLVKHSPTRRRSK